MFPMANQVKWPKMIQGIVGHSQESLKGCNHIDCLCDEMVMEILLRLPNCKSVIQCMCVCKRWAALASHPRFMGKFIALKLRDLNNKHTFAIVMRNTPDRICRLGRESGSFFRPLIFDVQESSFTPLSSCLRDDNASESAMVVASCKDLLLYCNHDKIKYDYYISNVQTRQYVVLPSLPFYHGIVGFICDTFFSCDKEIVYRYSVVVVRYTSMPSTKFSAHIFSSHCDSQSQWCSRVLSLPKTCNLKPRGPSSGFSFCFDGKLHFSCLEGIFGFDHNSIGFDDEIPCHLVEWPVGMLLGNQQVGVSQENMYVSDYCWDTVTSSVWVLKDYKEGNWMLQHRVEMREWVSRDSWIATELKKFSRHRVLGFHPGCSDVIYVVAPGYIFLCDLATKSVELACDIPVAVAKRYNNYVNKFYAFPIIFQSWPTPLAPLAQSLRDGANATPCSCSGL